MTKPSLGAGKSSGFMRAPPLWPVSLGSVTSYPSIALTARRGMVTSVPRNLMRDRTEGQQRVTNVELFFDLVYVFAVTQLSHHLLPRPTVEKALQTALLLAM